MTSKYQDVPEFYRLLGLTNEDPIVLGKKYYRKAINTILDIPDFYGQEQTYITPNSVLHRRLKANVMRYVTGYSDLDFKNYDYAMCEVENIKAIMDDFGFYYGVVSSGRGLQLYVPINIDDVSMGEELNRVLNKWILREYYLDRIIDRSLITNSATFLRLPGTINSKNGKMAEIIHHNFDPSIDYFTHNYEILLREYSDFLNSPPKVLTEHFSTAKFDYDHGSFRSILIERMIGLDPEIVLAVREKGRDRQLNGCVYTNLAVYTYAKPEKIEGAYEFVRQIKGDEANLTRWLDRQEHYETGDKKKLKYNAKALLNWAERYFGPDHPVTKYARNDFIRLKYHNGYFKFIVEQPSYDSVDLMREDMGRFVQDNRNVAGFHWVIGETGIGKSTIFEKLHRSGLRVVTLVPFLMLLYNMDRQSVYTFDSIGYSRRKRMPLMRDMMAADVIVIDEAHCQKTFRAINEEKAKILDLLDETLVHMAELQGKPIFLLTSTPSVEQIPIIEDRDASKFTAFLKKEQKRVSIHLIDDESLQEAVKANDRVLIFMDHKNEVKETRRYLESIGIDKKIFTVTKDEAPKEKLQIEREIKTSDKYVIIGTSSVSSGINIPLDTIIFTNRVMNQQTVYQVMGRLRIINKLDQVHPIYILKQPTYRIPDWAESMDLFEFVSSEVLITYISKLYKIVEIKDHSRSKVTSFSRLNKTEDLVRLIKSTKHISEFYGLPEVQRKKLYLIPNDIVRELGKSGWLDQNGWANISYREIDNLRTDDGLKPHGGKVKCRNSEYGYHNPVSHYFDPVELCKAINCSSDKNHFLRTLPKKVKRAVQEFFQTDFTYNDKRMANGTKTVS